MKPFSDACEQNKQPILEVLKTQLANAAQVLELGSGTGQHAVYFAAELPHLQWQPSDVMENLAGIHAWLMEARLDNIASPLCLDVNQTEWHEQTFDAVFSANTVHIMDWRSVENMFAGIGRVLEQEGRFCLYGPFNYNGCFTSESNARFDSWLKTRNPNSGVRDFEHLDILAGMHGMVLCEDYAMPANNRTLVWQKQQFDLGQESAE